MPPRKRIFRPRVCRFCTEKDLVIDYKDSKSLRNLVTERVRSYREEYMEHVPSTNAR